ncbi:hypothetical protein SEA_MACGULLY_2 [Rhodococcus phage MacGully]|nr:hypothetical protein SEA_MACGULLY_2 [Rhodococcus phage MacGully]
MPNTPIKQITIPPEMHQRMGETSKVLVADTDGLLDVLAEITSYGNLDSRPMTFEERRLWGAAVNVRNSVAYLRELLESGNWKEQP